MIVPDSDTKGRILDASQTLIQERGYHAFSFRDLSEAVGIRSASVHYHYRTKPDLAVALLKRYRGAFVGELAERRTLPPDERLGELAGLFESTHQLGRMCLCGSLASDLETLPPEIRREVAAFYDAVQEWIAQALNEGMEAGVFRKVDSHGTAEALLSLLEGALLSSRVRQSNAPLAAARAWIELSLRA